MNKHTPGPWNHKIELPVSYHDAPHFLIGHAGDNSIGEVGIANARLIAEAPAMLEALRDLLAYEEDPVPKQSWDEVSGNARAILARIDA